jgi:hypothetical protein
MHPNDFHALNEARAGYRRFLDDAADGQGGYRLTPRAEATSFARCFAIFGLHLLRDTACLAAGADRWALAIRADLDTYRRERTSLGVTLARDKPYLQLLTFSLSALSVLDRLATTPLSEHVTAALSHDVDADFAATGVLEGAPGSGNQAMMMAILLLYARDHLGLNTEGRLDRWTSLLLVSRNRFGFWGRSRSMSHLQFQNGYHQYEVFEYLGVGADCWPNAAAHVASLADSEGHFAPYPGGSGCYDYDGVFMLTGAGPAIARQYQDLLQRTASEILRDRNPDGGFYESRCVRPRSPTNLRRLWQHVRAGRGAARRERLRYALALLRPRNDRIHTHWSRYSREWSESNVWDSWFRMLTLARIQVALDASAATSWGFIDFPGIGYHHALGEARSPRPEVGDRT